MKILILTACTSKKKFKPANLLTKKDFKAIGTPAFKVHEEQLNTFQTAAGEMYTGQQHLRVMRGLQKLRQAGLSVDLKIVSAGYGLLNENTLIVPYEMTFIGMRKKEYQTWAQHLKLSEITQYMRLYDLVLVLLGKEYLRAIDFGVQFQHKGILIFISAAGAIEHIPTGPDIYTIALNNQTASRLGAGLVSLKGRILELIGIAVSQKGTEFIEKIMARPETLLELIAPFATIQLSTPPKKKPEPDIAVYDTRIIKLSTAWKNKTHRSKMRYFIPEWDDYVNPEYDFLNDIHPSGTGDHYELAHYAHQIFQEPPYDGILISKVIVESKKAKKALLEKIGVHRYLRVPREFPIMGDCGAFGYLMEENPPYTTEEILNYYQNLDFDYGVSIDHMIVKAVLKKEQYYLLKADQETMTITETEFLKLKSEGITEAKSKRYQRKLFEQELCIFKKEVEDEVEKKRRYELTINNARDFIEKHQKKAYTFTPIGAVQGWSPASYAEAVQAYQQMGYTYIALGGLVRTTTKKILEILEAVALVLKPRVDLHLFGVARPDSLHAMQQLGITSIDSASFLRRAWLGAYSNYWTVQGKYAAIRIPDAEKNPRIKQIVQQGRAGLEEVKNLEQECFAVLRTYQQDAMNIEKVLKVIMSYDNLMGGNRKGNLELFRKTLIDRPWEKCPCPICKKIGIEIIIFRGNNRNRRRGFHNTKIFYDQFCHIFEE